MIAYVIVAAVAVAVVGVIARVWIDLARDLREDRRAHGGRLTTNAFHKVLAVAAFVVVLVLLLIVVPLLGVLD